MFFYSGYQSSLVVGTCISNCIHIKVWDVITHPCYSVGIIKPLSLGHGWVITFPVTLQWRHNGHDSVSNHQPHDCLLNRLFRRRPRKTSKLRVTGLCAGNSPGPVKSPHKWPLTRKIFPFDDVIMETMEEIWYPSPDELIIMQIVTVLPHTYTCPRPIKHSYRPNGYSLQYLVMNSH